MKNLTRKPIAIKYRGPLGPRTKVEFVTGAIFDDKGFLSDRAFMLYRIGFKIREQKLPNGDMQYIVSAPTGDSTGEVLWWQVATGDKAPDREWLIDRGIEQHCLPNGQIELIYREEPKPSIEEHKEIIAEAVSTDDETTPAPRRRK